jgi:DNA invertase Pin-like site-specific DNA recombinase
MGKYRNLPIENDMSATENTPAFAYLRTSSLTNSDGDSQPRQLDAIQRRAAADGYELKATFTDVGVSGAMPAAERPAFARMLDALEANGTRTVIVEDASRLARDLIASETAILLLIERGVRVLTAAGDDLADDSDPMRTAMRQIAGAFAQAEKARLVAKLRGARDRASQAAGKRVEGRKSYAETAPELVKEAKRLRRASPKTGKRRSYATIASELTAAGWTTGKGTDLTPMHVKRMCDS